MNASFKEHSANWPPTEEVCNLTNRLKYNVFFRTRVSNLGSDLDRGMYPKVQDGGIVTPGDLLIQTTPGVETKHAGTQSSPSAAEPGPFTRPPRAPSSLQRANIQEQYNDELNSVLQAYPHTRVWRKDDGMWLLTTSLILEGLAKAATFLLAFSWSNPAVRAWGYWRESAVSVQWIGPRHTNFPDGSICAFDPEDRTWLIGDSLTSLLDLYSVWAFRHLHVEMFGRWPGAQAVRHPYERRIEFTMDELCGCGSSSTYRHCCSSNDAVRNYVRDAISFTSQTAGGLRSPPAALAQVALDLSQPPPIATVRW